MVELTLAAVSMIGFALSCRFFMKALLSPVPIFNTSDFSKSALKLQKSYLVLAWGIMTGIFLSSVIASMIEVYLSL